MNATGNFDNLVSLVGRRSPLQKKKLDAYLSRQDGLLDQSIFCVRAGGDGTLWFGTEKGASRFDPLTKQFRNYRSGTNGLTNGAVFGIE